MPRLRIVLALLLLPSLTAAGQPDTTSDVPVLERADYRFAQSFRNLASEVTNLRLNWNWVSDREAAWAAVEADQMTRWEYLDLPANVRRPLFDHERLASTLAARGDSATAGSLPIEYIEFVSPDSVGIWVADSLLVLDLHSYSLRPANSEDGGARTVWSSPDSSWDAFKRDHNLWVRHTPSGEEKQLTQDGSNIYEHASYFGWGDIIRGENGIRPDRTSIRWSPNSRFILSNAVDLRSARKMFLLDWSADSLYRPELLSYYRGSPGDTGMVNLEPYLFEVETGRVVRPQVATATHINAPEFQWTNGGTRLFAIETERGFKKRHISEIDLESGHARRLFTDSSETNVHGGSFFRRFLSTGTHAIISSERTGWNHLYVLDLSTGALTAVTSGDWTVSDLEYFDEDEELIWFTAMGREENRNPYFDHLYRVNLDGDGLTLLTPEDAHHEVNFRQEGAYFADTWSTPTQEPIHAIRSADSGKPAIIVAEADASAIRDRGWKGAEPFTFTARDGQTTLHGVLFRPVKFDSSSTYPVVDFSYTGPHGFQYPNSFRKTLRGGIQEIVQMGFVGVVIDGLGTSGRSKAFRDWSYKMLGHGTTDHILGIKELGVRHSWVDTSRVGITGHSAGGYDATQALLRFPEFYKVGVSSSADHDHRMEKAWWPEMYMGWPVDDAYHEQSNITMAGNLRGRLLITHGGIDENVNPSATFKLAEALVQADKQFDMLIFPSQRHGYRGQTSRYFQKRRLNYFVEHLMGAKPLW